MTAFVRGLRASFRAAWRGFLYVFHAERTFRVMVAAALCVFIGIGTLPLSSAERLVLLLVTGMILVLELLNTAVERLVDLVKPRLSAYVRDVKDVMAAAVLVASFFGLLVGVIILFPHLTLLFAQL